MTTRTQLSIKNMGKPHSVPKVPSGGTTGYANSRAIGTSQDGRKPKIGGGTATTYFANSRSMDGSTSQRNVSTGPTHYTNFMITKSKGRKK